VALCDEPADCVDLDFAQVHVGRYFGRPAVAGRDEDLLYVR